MTVESSGLLLRKIEFDFGGDGFVRVKHNLCVTRLDVEDEESEDNRWEVELDGFRVAAGRLQDALEDVGITDYGAMAAPLEGFFVVRNNTREMIAAAVGCSPEQVVVKEA